jgi:hypothetical protein
MIRMQLTKHKGIFAFVVICAAAALLASCATQPPVNAYDPPGFFSGLLHGFLIFFGFLAGLFTEYRIYAFPNSGGWYDFGYLIGAAIFLGGGASAC